MAPVKFAQEVGMRLLLDFLLIPITFAGLPGTLQAATEEMHAKVTALARVITYSSAALFPTEATQLGIPGYDAQLESPSEANRSAYLDELQQWQQQLGQLAPAGRGDLRWWIAMMRDCWVRS